MSVLSVYLTTLFFFGNFDKVFKLVETVVYQQDASDLNGDLRGDIPLFHQGGP